MDNTMTITVADEVIDMLTTLYSDQPTFKAEKVRVIVANVVDEVIEARKYRNAGYTDEQIEKDLFKYKSQIKNIAEYDFAHFGAPHEVAHSENSVNRTWVDRNKLFSGIVSLAQM